MTVLLELCSAESVNVQNGNNCESAALTINAKLIVLAVKEASSRLVVCFSDSKGQTFRRDMPRLYNELWDACMDAGKFNLDTVVLEDDSASIIGRDQSITVVLNAGPEIDTCAMKSSTIKLKSLDFDLQEEANGVRYHLFDNPAEELPVFKKVAVGGTFDHFHNGHKKLLSICAMVTTEELIVGVTDDAMLGQKKLKEFIEDLDERRGHVSKYIETLGRLSLFANVCVISDLWGPTVTVADVQALVCSTETLKGARLINEERVKRGMQPLQVVAVARSNTYVLSSTFMRRLKADSNI